MLKPLLEDKSVLKIAQNLKYDLVIMSRYGIDVAPFDDTMLISYVLDAGTAHGHGIDALAEKWLGHTTTPAQGRDRLRQGSVGFDQVDIDRATAYAAEARRRDAAALAGAEAAACRQGPGVGL